MAGVSNNPNSARQKMINLMYLVFIAMMALNVSSEVLDGFELVEHSLRASTENSTTRNEYIMANLDRAYQANPTKVGEWRAMGVNVKSQSDDLVKYIEELKLRIVQESDGKDGDVEDIEHKDDLEAASRIMLAPVVGDAKKLKERLDGYCATMCNVVDDPSKKTMFESILSTKPVKKAGVVANSWETALFENMPVSAVVTLLTKMQSDIRTVEGEVLSTLITNVDADDYRVNKIDAFIVPKSQIVTSGMPYEAMIVLAAVDSTRRPEYFLNGRKLENNIIKIPSGAIGDHSITGEVTTDGNTYPFSTNYSVTASTATIAPALMNFLYESIENDLEIAMPGVPSGAVRAELRGNNGHGKIERKPNTNNIWTVTGLNMKSAPEVEVVLIANVGGSSVSESKSFKVRELPDPLPYLVYQDTDGRSRKYTGGLLPKRNLMDVTGVLAAVDDGLLNIPHKVTGFTLSFTDGMGNTIPEISNSSEFTPRQKDLIRNLARGKQFSIYNVKALKPSGEPVNIKYSITVIVN